ncbi:hypothetical protein EJB05_31581, partial [Eragrostis curvula]
MHAAAAGRDSLGDPGAAAGEAPPPLQIRVHAIISDPAFSSARSSSAPPPNGSTTRRRSSSAPTTTLRFLQTTAIRFYRWKPQRGAEAEHLHTKDFGNSYGGFRRLRALAHCDGRHRAPPLQPGDEGRPHAAGRTATLTTCECPGHTAATAPGSGWTHAAACTRPVVQAFCKPVKEVPAYYLLEHPDYTEDTVPEMGMEVFTVAGYSGEWRKIDAKLPCPVKRHQTGVSVNGFIFWRIDRRSRQRRDEEFSVTKLPDPAFDDAFVLDELRGRELCISARTASETMTIWTMSIEDRTSSQSSWERRYAIRVSDLFRPMAILPGSGSIFLREEGGDSRTLHRYDLATSELTTLCRMDRVRYHQQGRGGKERKWKKSLASFDVRPYTESLVRVTRAPMPLVHPDKAGPCLIATLRAELLLAFRNGTL